MTLMWIVTPKEGRKMYALRRRGSGGGWIRTFDARTGLVKETSDINYARKFDTMTDLISLLRSFPEVYLISQTNLIVVEVKEISTPKYYEEIRIVE